MHSLLDQLVVDRPLAFIDIETTGTSVTDDRVVEIGLVIEYPRTADGIQEPFVKTRRINPGIPIPPEATEIHGIRDEDVRGASTFKDVSKGLWQLLDPCDIAGFNVRRFDLPLLRAEFRRCGMQLDHTTRRIIDLQFLFHHRERRDLGAAVGFYLGREHEEGHSAETDTAVLAELLVAQLEHYPDLPRDLSGLHAACDEFAPFRTEVEAWFGDDLSLPVFQRGKHKDKSLDYVLAREIGYIGWMMTQAEDMDPEVREFIQMYRRRAAAAPAVTP